MEHLGLGEYHFTILGGEQFFYLCFLSSTRISIFTQSLREMKKRKDLLEKKKTSRKRKLEYLIARLSDCNLRRANTIHSSQNILHSLKFYQKVKESVCECIKRFSLSEVTVLIEVFPCLWL